MNNEPGKYITEIKSADLKLKVVSNLSEAKNNRKIIFLKDTNGLEQSKRIENCSEKLDSNLTSTIEARILPPNVDVNKQIKFVGINAEGWRVMSEKEVEKTVLNQYLCNICTYCATQKGILKKHQKIKHGVKCYTCNYYKDKINRKNDLVGHLKKHHNVKVYFF